MGRGVSAGGGQSSLGYLFGSGEAPKPTEHKGGAPTKVPNTRDGTFRKSTASVPKVDVTKQIPAGIQGSQANNYFRTDGQNSSNFITDWPSTKGPRSPWWWIFLGLPFWRWWQWQLMRQIPNESLIT